MRWVDLAFLHWRVDPDMIRPLIPPDLTLETFDDAAWVGVVPFKMEDVRLRFAPAIPGTNAFPELNVRTYVRVGERFGVWFFSLDAANRLAVRGARFLYNLPYYDAAMAVHEDGEGIVYESRRVHRRAPAAASLPRITDRLARCIRRNAARSTTSWSSATACSRRAAPASSAYLDVHHLPWPLQPATARVDLNTMAAAAGLQLPDEPPLVHFSRHLEVLAWNRVTVIDARTSAAFDANI